MSIQGFSVKAGDQVIFACNEFYAPIVNHLLAAASIAFTPLMGSYKGKAENAWIINSDDYWKVKPMLHKEESILLLSGSKNSCNQRPAKLVFIDGATPDLDLGYFQESTRDVALKQDGFTIWHEVQANGAIVPRYFICANNDLHGNPILD